MTEWVTSDHHFFHFNIIKYTNRPFHSIDEMNHTMIQRWNELVKPEDVVYHLGDFAFFKVDDMDKVKDIFNSLNGKKKILVMGNHDKSKENMLKIGFDEVHENYLIIDRPDTNLLLSHRRISTMPTLNVSVELWNFFPIPLPTVRFPIQLCGHSHDSWLVSTESVSGNIHTIKEGTIKKMEHRSLEIQKERGAEREKKSGRKEG